MRRPWVNYTFRAQKIPILVCCRHRSRRAQWLAVKALHNNFITDSQTARLLMSVSIMPPLPHPSSSVSIPATVKLMCVTDRVTTVNRTDQTKDINNQDRPVDITTKLCRITATATAAGSTTTAGPAWQSFVGGLQHAPVRSTGADVGDAVCMSAASVLLVVMPIGSPVSLAIEQKPSKDDQNKKLNTSFTNSKSESDLKTRKCCAQNGRVGRRFLLYTALS